MVRDAREEFESRQDPDDDPQEGNPADLMKAILSGLFPEESFDIKITSLGKFSMAIVKNSPDYFAEREAIAKDLSALDALLSICERRPEPGTVHTFTLLGQQVQLPFDGMENLLRLVRVGIRTTCTFHNLNEDEEEQIQAFEQRIATLEER